MDKVQLKINYMNYLSEFVNNQVEIEKNEAYIAVKKEIDDFDYGQLLQSGSSKDEFNFESYVIYKELPKADSVEFVQNLVKDVFEYQFNESISLERCLAVATCLFANAKKD